MHQNSVIGPLLFTTPLGSVILKNSLEYHLFADDTRPAIYITSTYSILFLLFLVLDTWLQKLIIIIILLLSYPAFVLNISSEVSVVHEWEDNKRFLSKSDADAEQCDDVSVVEFLHLSRLLHDPVDHLLLRITL